MRLSHSCSRVTIAKIIFKGSLNVVRMSYWKILIVAFLCLFFTVKGSAQMFVSNYGGGTVSEFDATTGAFLGTFVPSVPHPDGVLFGPDGNFYVSISDGEPPQVLRYNGQTGAFMGVFASSASGCNIGFTDMVFGPNGNFFVGHYGCPNFGAVEQYDSATGTYLGIFASIVPDPSCTCVQGITFGPDGNLYVATEVAVQEFNGQTGAFIRTFAFPPANSNTDAVAFGPDGNLYVSTASTTTFDNSGGQILKYDPVTGSLLGVFIPPFTGGLGYASRMTFLPDGRLYIVDNAFSQVLRFDATTGSFVDAFVPSGSGGLNRPINLTFAPLYHICLLYDPTKAAKSGSTIPIKLQLCDSSGNDLSSSNITVHAVGVTQVSTSIGGTVEDSGNANPDNDFRFDITLGPTGGYIFNFKTSGLTTGTYNLNFTAGSDPVTHVAPFEVK